MADSWDDIHTWLHDNENRVFRLWVFKKMFTPYEQEQKFLDESVYECDECNFVYIREIINLNNGDYLIGVESAGNNDFTIMEYYPLSEIRLGYCSKDMEDDEE